MTLTEVVFVIMIAPPVKKEGFICKVLNSGKVVKRLKALLHHSALLRCEAPLSSRDACVSQLEVSCT